MQETKNDPLCPYRVSVSIPPSMWDANHVLSAVNDQLARICRDVCSPSCGFFSQVVPVQPENVLACHPVDFDGTIRVDVAFTGRTHLPAAGDHVTTVIYRITSEGLFLSSHMLRVFVALQDLLDGGYEIEQDFSTSVVHLRLKQDDDRPTWPRLLRVRDELHVELVFVQHEPSGFVAIGRALFLSAP